MIKYQLICNQDHEFEGWFQTSNSFEEQAAKGLLCCPICDSDQVRRALMTPNLLSPKHSSSGKLTPTESSHKIENPTSPDNARASTKAQQMQGFGAALATIRQIQQKITKECRDVGDDFAEEARKIHYGEAEAEGIYGHATESEREALQDEGIEVLDMPWLPPDQ